MKPIFIAEIKTQSPHGFRSPYSFIELMEAAIQYGDWISVHDNALWGGDYETISFVRKYTDKPILAKGLHTTEESINRAIDHGATKVLVVGNTFDGHFSSTTILREISDIAPQNLWGRSMGHNKIVINSRNLRTGSIVPNIGTKITNFKKIGFEVFQASNIKTPDDINPDASGFIVGTNLMEFIKCR